MNYLGFFVCQTEHHANIPALWGQSGDKGLLRLEEAGRKRGQRRLHLLLCLLAPLALGIVTQQDGRIVADARGDNIDRHPRIKQRCGVDAAQGVEPNAEAEQIGAAAGPVVGPVARVQADNSCRNPILLAGAARDDLERVVS